MDAYTPWFRRVHAAVLTGACLALMACGSSGGGGDGGGSTGGGGGNRPKAAAATEANSFIIREDGTLWVIGSWGHGQIGVAGSWTAIAGSGFHALGLKTDGTLWAAGSDEFGQLGDGAGGTASDAPFVQVGTDSDWVTITCGMYYSLALKENGTLWAWGNNASGQLGDGTTDTRHVPVQIGTWTDWTAVSAGSAIEGFTLGIRSNGTLWAWGDNTYGQLGTAPAGDVLEPAQIGTDDDWQFVSAGGYHSMGIRSGGTLWGWGQNGLGVIGDGTDTDRHAPVQVGGGTDWSTVSASSLFNLAVTTDGRLQSWGYEEFEQLGNGGGNFTSSTGSRDMPGDVTLVRGWPSISTSASYSLGLSADGSLWAWGLNFNGQFGDGFYGEEVVARPMPVHLWPGDAD